MKRFRFRLEKILGHKITVEDGCREKLADAERVFHDHRRKIEEMRERERGWQAVLKEQQSGSLSVRDVILHQTGIAALARKIVQQGEVLKKLNCQVAAARNDLIAAQRERKTLEKLKEKNRQSHQTILERHEQKITDETGIAGFNRREQHGP